MYAEAVGTVVSAKRQWWLKVNTKIFRTYPLDGATFPHIIKVKYTVDGVEYTRKKWVRASTPCPSVGTAVTVVYRVDKPKKGKIIL